MNLKQKRILTTNIGRRIRSFYMAPETGLEPVTHQLTADCSTIEPLRNGIFLNGTL